MGEYSWFHGPICVFYIWNLVPPFPREKKWTLKSASFLALCNFLFIITFFSPFDFCDMHFQNESHGVPWGSSLSEILWPVHLTHVFLFPYRSFLCGGSTGLFIYAYCLYYYHARSDMSGFMQTSFFFGYMACICYGFFLMLGTVGFRASLLFVRHIYRSIKCE